MPQHHSGGNGDIERMLRTELRDLQSEVRRINNFLSHSINLIAENQRELFTAGKSRCEAIEADRTHRLLNTDNLIAFVPKHGDNFKGTVRMLPRHTVLGS